MANKRIIGLKGKYFWIFERQDKALTKRARKNKKTQSAYLREILDQFLTP